MCGIAGFWAQEVCRDDAVATLTAMGHAIAHRGPDAEGLIWDEKVHLGLVHRRLAIQDLSPAGAQPMKSSSGRFVIIFNGEIYNFRALAAELEFAGHHFRGHSDTEVMLAAFEQWGVENSLKRFAGMFAFAVWDCHDARLWLVRDRMGEKPLYYGWHHGTLLFASELKAMHAFPGFSPEINRDALTLLLRHNYIPAPHSIYRNIYKLLPSHFLRFNLLNRESKPGPHAYWSLSDSFQSTEKWDLNTAEEELDCRLGEVIKEQMIADVPLGAFLSGGIDSSTVVALMQKHSNRAVRTFSIGFDVSGFNEAVHAAAVARYLGTDHTELYVTPGDALDVIPNLPELYDEPFADSSQIPTYLVCRMARQQVTVALSGDGGDELFAGYSHYAKTLAAWQQQHVSPGWKERVGHTVAGLPQYISVPLVRMFVPDQRRLSLWRLREKLLIENKARKAKDIQDFYACRIGYWAHPERLVLGTDVPPYVMTQKCSSSVAKLSDLKQLQWLDLNCYLPDDILTKVDRAAMAVSLETRIPLLDHRIVSFALGLPDNLICNGNTGKAVLRRVLHRYVPKELVDRPKQGFAIPVAQWLRKELRDWAEALLDESRLRREGFWEVKLIRQAWADHLDGKEDYNFKLWSVLMFQAWLDRNKRSVY